MSLKRFFSAALSAALLISLCACAPKGTAGSDDPASGSDSRTSPLGPGPVGTSLEDPSTSDPMAPPPPKYDKEHSLNTEIPALVDGLEMPIYGATGYTSVELPVWPEIPPEPEDDDSEQDPSEQEPSPDEPPDGSDSSTPAPDEPVDPVPGETSDPAPDETADPVPGETIDPVPDDTVDPASGEEVDPTPGGTADSDSGLSIRPDTSVEFPQPPDSEPTEEQDPPADPTISEEPESESESETEEEPDPYEGAVAVWEPGTAFVIVKEEGGWWYAVRGAESGWIEHRYCMINLPDVIPSIIYDDTNAYSSLFVSCGKDIPDITGKALYSSLANNARLDRQEFMMPILYSAARNICDAQHKALAEGNCLVVYQTFRPYDTQIAVARAMSKLANGDPEVKAGISTPPWSISWFIATGTSNHQRGYALDVSMVKVYETETMYVESYPYLRMTDYEDYKMPTAMHELSVAAISTISPSSGQLSETMNEPAIALRTYFTSSGLSPLASEWWHFNDNAAMRDTSDNPSNGRYFITECLSCFPEQALDLLPHTGQKA